MPETTGRMRILKVVQSYFPFQDRGGPVFKVRALATGLALWAMGLEDAAFWGFVAGCKS